MTTAVMHFWQRLRQRAAWELREWRTPSNAAFVQEELDQALLEEIDWRPGERVLDVGCAGGRYLTALAHRGAAAVGVDLNHAALRSARSRECRVARSSAGRLPFSDATFDTLVCHKTLHYLDAQAEAAGEFSRVLRPGGRLVFSSSNGASPYALVQRRALSRDPASNWACANRLAVKDWCRIFTAAGFRLQTVYSCNLVWPLVYRVCDRWIIPNEAMRRYNRLVRRLSGLPLAGGRPRGAAMDYVVVMVRQAGG